MKDVYSSKELATVLLRVLNASARGRMLPEASVLKIWSLSEAFIDDLIIWCHKTTRFGRRYVVDLPHMGEAQLAHESQLIGSLCEAAVDALPPQLTVALADRLLTYKPRLPISGAPN